MKNLKSVRITIFTLTTVAVNVGWLSGCTSIHQQGAIEAIQESNTAKNSDNKGLLTNQPYVEAFIEYAGPDPRWAGPGAYTLHLVARDGQWAQLKEYPPLIRKNLKQSREVASVISTDISQPSPAAPQGGVPSKGFALEKAREQLKDLAASFATSELLGLPEGGPELVRGCMYPVHVKLVKLDGSLVEKRGCRAQVGWPKKLSTLVAEWQASI